ncbi:sacsin N-terminal ATP-binding-like domain-containing protein [Williamsia sterculiae]|uniref:Uncharacterized protein n=1 Tax=Williamsia sterculiae TaxID=1344003 RepID=A0A1N7GW08_9NOCA|nr:hypothetical protein [Williamsia sterculiae]SIS16742.1 hypothetical protein SAMN05445060_3153 [Williamsia sterculiae]
MTTSPPDLDPFDTETLRASVLGAWRASPTRLAEDVATESDLTGVGYRDRLFTELAANAADAAVRAGVRGAMSVWTTDGRLHVANRGAPLTAAGVRALAATRVSDKSEPGLVGRFGVGFHAVAVIADAVTIRSVRGGVAFDLARTADAVGTVGLPGPVPLLRLPWPVNEAPAEGFDTEIVITPRAGIDLDHLLDRCADEAPELLLELEALDRITVTGNVFERSGGWLPVSTTHARWLIHGSAERVRPLRETVLCAPTRTDVELTIPAKVFADIAITADRRSLHPDADIASLADGYHRLPLAVAADQRVALVPAPGFARNSVDETLRAAILDDLSRHTWLPGADGADLVPSRAVVFADLPVVLADHLADLLGGLVHPALSGRGGLPRLRSVGVTEIGLAELAERLTGVQRPPGWWHDLYEALSPSVVDDRAAAELGALPVPRADGRLHVGARGLAIGPDRATTAIPWIPTVHPDAAHPLLERLGARRIPTAEVLADPALRSWLDQDPDDADPDDLAKVTDAVIALIAAEPDVAVPDWLGAILLRSTDGELRPADELLLPDSPLAAVLAPDAPFGILADTDHPEVVRRLGVGWGFVVVTDDLPTGPDHDLPDEDRWWDRSDEPPTRLAAVRDLDLVDDSAWPEALTLLADDPAVADQLRDRDGYTAWWLRTHARIDDTPLWALRAPGDAATAGLYDTLDHPRADELGAALATITVVDDDQAVLLLDHLADPARAIAPGVVTAAHSALVAAYRSGALDLDRVDAPARVRAVDGSTPSSALAVDAAQYLQILTPGDVVLTTSPLAADDARDLGTVLDIGTAGEELDVVVMELGNPTIWRDSAIAVLFATAREMASPMGEVRLHDRLVVRVTRGGTVTDHAVAYWLDRAGVMHLQR